MALNTALFLSRHCTPTLPLLSEEFNIKTLKDCIQVQIPHRLKRVDLPVAFCCCLFPGGLEPAEITSDRVYIMVKCCGFYSLTMSTQTAIHSKKGRRKIAVYLLIPTISCISMCGMCKEPSSTTNQGHGKFMPG